MNNTYQHSLPTKHLLDGIKRVISKQDNTMKILEMYGTRPDGTKIEFKESGIKPNIRFDEFKSVTTKKEMTVKEFKKQYPDLLKK